MNIAEFVSGTMVLHNTLGCYATPTGSGNVVNLNGTWYQR